jgi:hypothetical protein
MKSATLNQALRWWGIAVLLGLSVGPALRTIGVLP